MRNQRILALVVCALPAWAAFGQASQPSKWTIRTDKSKMDDSPGVLLSLTSEAPISGWMRTRQPELALRCSEGETTAYVVTGMPAQPELGEYQRVSVRYRIDGREPTAEMWSESTDNEALFSPHAKALIGELSKAQRFRFEFTPFNSSPVIIEFRVQGLPAIVGRLDEACRRSIRTEALQMAAPVDSTAPLPAETRTAAVDSAVPRNTANPFPGWRLALQSCLPAVQGRKHCAISVENGTSIKTGFRLENVTAFSGSADLGTARDFNYVPRSSWGLEHLQGNCEPHSSCGVDFLVDAHSDRLTFSLSLWGAGWAGTKQRESSSVVLKIPPP